MTLPFMLYGENIFSTFFVIIVLSKSDAADAEAIFLFFAVSADAVILIR